jgi:hypothetical protein
VEVTLAEPPVDLDGASIPSSARLLTHEGGRLMFETHDDGMDALVKWLARHQVVRLLVHEPTLEDLFLRYYEGGSVEEELPASRGERVPS